MRDTIPPSLPQGFSGERLCLTCAWGITMTTRYKSEPDETWRDGEAGHRDERTTYCSHPMVSGPVVEGCEPLEIAGTVIECQGWKALEEPVAAPKPARRRSKREKDRQGTD